MLAHRVRSVSRSVIVGTIALLVVFGAPAAKTLTRCLELGRQAVALRHLPLDERRAHIYGSWYREVRRIRALVPENATIDIVMANADARDVAVFAGAALAPRDCRLFAGWESFDRRRRAELVNDKRAVNAVRGSAPPPATLVLLVDSQLDPPIRVVVGRGGR